MCVCVGGGGNLYRHSSSLYATNNKNTGEIWWHIFHLSCPFYYNIFLIDLFDWLDHDCLKFLNRGDIFVIWVAPVIPVEFLLIYLINNLDWFIRSIESWVFSNSNTFFFWLVPISVVILISFWSVLRSLLITRGFQHRFFLGSAAI